MLLTNRLHESTSRLRKIADQHAICCVDLAIQSIYGIPLGDFPQPARPNSAMPANITSLANLPNRRRLTKLMVS